MSKHDEEEYRIMKDKIIARIDIANEFRDLKKLNDERSIALEEYFDKNRNDSAKKKERNNKNLKRNSRKQ